MRNFLDDFRFGARLMMRSPGVALTAVLALALGIGANTAIFSVVFNVLLKPLPVREPDRLFVFSHTNEQRKLALNGTPYPDVVEWRKQLRSVETIAAVTHAAMSLTSGTDEPERVYAGKVTEGFFPMIGVGTVVGRGFLSEEDQPGKARSAILSHELWMRRFGGTTNTVGSQIQLDGDAYTVVGVLTPKFRWVGQKTDLFLPLGASEVRSGRPQVVTAYGRRKAGVTEQQLQAEFDVMTAATIAREPRYKNWRLKPGPITEWIVPDVKTSLWVLLGAVALVLLIACANVANLLLSGAAARRREMAVRAALGAGRGRLIAQLLAESTPLGLAGGLLGLLLAWCVRALPLLDAGRIPRLAETGIDLTVLAFTAGVSVVTCLLFGLAPALALSRTDLHDSLKDGGRSSTTGVRGRRLRGLLVASEVAIALVLAVGATLLVRTFTSLSEVDPGFRPEGVLTASVELPREKTKSREQLLAFFDGVLGRIRSMPGVLHAGLTNSLPLGGNYFRGDWKVEGRQYREGDIPILNERIVDPEYFKALQIPLRRGRLFDANDTKGSAPVAILNETTARRLFPGEDPLGRRMGSPGNWATIVGIVGDIRHTDVALEADTEFLAPFHQIPRVAMTFVVRLDPALYPDPMRFAPLLRRAVANISRDQAVFQMLPFEKIISNRLAPRRLSMIVLIAFAGLSLVLAAMGIYGVLAFSVEQRTHEIGVRMALGAQQGDVLRIIVREAVLLAAGGLVVGVAAALALGRLATSLLYGVTATDPLVLTGTAVLLALVAAAAAWFPARRATRVDPLEALRYE